MSNRAEQEAEEIHYLALIEANRIAREQWDKGYKQAEKDTIERAAEWLDSLDDGDRIVDVKAFVEAFKNEIREDE